MLKLVTTLQRAIISGHHFHLRPYSSIQVINHVVAPPKWHQICFRHHQHLVASNGKLGFVTIKYNQKIIFSSCTFRGLTTKSSPASETPNTRVIAWYLRMLNTYPLPTKSITAGNILAFADITGQCLTNMKLKKDEPKQQWDKIRTLRMLVIGAFVSAPSLHMWFNVMQKVLPNSDVASSMKKVLAGQFLASPILNCIFFATNSFLQGESKEQAIEKIKQDLWPTWKSGAMYWPILDFITFRFIKIHLQVFFNNCCSFIWTIYLTSMASKKVESPSQKNQNSIEQC